MRRIMSVARSAVPELERLALEDRAEGPGARAVLMKGGHVPGETVTDLLVTATGETLMEGPRV